MNKGEFELIDFIRKQFNAPEGVTGIGDDCAVIPQTSGDETLVSTDLLIEGVHFLLTGVHPIDPYSLGWKSAAVNISDIAAMGGVPTGSFLSLAIPKTLSDTFLEEFFKGYKDLSDKFDCPLLGGDTTSSTGKLCISVTVTGKCVQGRALKRSAALEGDLICVTGPLGDSAAGLHAILHNLPRTEITDYLINKHFRPMPRVDAGLVLTEHHRTGIGAAMDISDGIGSDIRHIMEESGVGARIDVGAVPLSRELQLYCRENGLDPLDFALSGGEDYELLFTCAKGVHLPFDFWVIGEITSTGTLEWTGGSKDYQGFRHF